MIISELLDLMVISPPYFIFCFISPDFYNSGYKQALWSQKDLRFVLDFGRPWLKTHYWSSGLYLLIYHEGTLPIPTPLRTVMIRSRPAQWWVNKCSKMLASVMIRKKVLFCSFSHFKSRSLFSSRPYQYFYFSSSW